jgi:hypothetical protein
MYFKYVILEELCYIYKNEIENTTNQNNETKISVK